MQTKRYSGILLPIFSLPGKYGCGDFGKGAFDFIDLLHAAGFHYWQVLPFTRTDACNSPYKSDSAFAGNPYFINLDELYEMGLLTKEELDENAGLPDYLVSYDALSERRKIALRRAMDRADGELWQKVREFRSAQADWIEDYALYMALKDESGKDWADWDDAALRNHESAAVQAASVRLANEMAYYYFEQYLFFTQWQKVHAYAAEKNVEIIGDMPIYVSFESADVWSARELFDLNENGYPNRVAGVPPDYFSKTGQKWGNPLYNWTAMRADGYAWWKRRLSHTLHQSDKVRIDHFRAFSAYWAVPFDAEDARSGEWIYGEGMKFFDEIYTVIDKDAIIAEDLGVQDDKLTALLRDSGLPGMKVLQFGFLGGNDDPGLPHNYPLNCVAYSGTHDNTPLLAYLWELTPEQRDYCLRYCNFGGSDWQSGGTHNAAIRAVLKSLWASHAATVISPIQDILGYGGDTTTNRPGTSEGNWLFRMTPAAIREIDIPYLRELNELYKRV